MPTPWMHKIKLASQAGLTKTEKIIFVGASLLTFVPTYMTKDHRKDGKCFEGKEPIGFVTRMHSEGGSRLSGCDFLTNRQCFCYELFF